MRMEIRPDVARRLAWSRPDSSIAPFCSVCQKHIPDDAVPLRMWNDEGWTVHFCDDCAQTAIAVRQ
jgi:hypothetical protein